jgi:hypothetical protein
LDIFIGPWHVTFSHVHLHKYCNTMKIVRQHLIVSGAYIPNYMIRLCFSIKTSISVHRDLAFIFSTEGFFIMLTNWWMLREIIFECCMWVHISFICLLLILLSKHHSWMLSTPFLSEGSRFKTQPGNRLSWGFLGFP